MKFIIIEKTDEYGLIMYFPFIFNGSIVHSYIYIYSFSVELMKMHYKDCTYKCVSAGFFNVNLMKCYGESETLKIKCHSLSEFIINKSEYYSVYDQNNKLIK